MKTFQQFKEESDKFGIKKTMNNFMQNQNVQNLLTNMKDGNLNINDMKSTAKSFAKDAKKIAGSKEVQNLKTAGLETLQKGANNMLNKIFDAAKKID